MAFTTGNQKPPARQAIRNAVMGPQLAAFLPAIMLGA